MKTKHTMLGIEGELERRPYIAPGRLGIVTFANQKFKASRKFHEDGTRKTIIVNVRFDDDCKNGHNTFAITGQIWNPKRPGDCETAGCIHEEIHKHFPELRGLIKWHLFSTDGPSHYPGNVTYLAGDRDCHGKRKGEPWAWDDVAYIGNSPFPNKVKISRFLDWMKARIDFLVSTPRTNKHWSEFKPVAVAHKEGSGFTYSDNYTLEGYDADWALCPFNDPATAQAWADSLNIHVKSLRSHGQGFVRFDKIPTLFSEGKARELKAARSSACWPEITDEQLCLPKAELEALLMARLPSLIEEFKADMLACGFLWSVEDESPAPEA